MSSHVIMAPHISITITFFFFLFFFSSSLIATKTKDIHDMISDYGLPKGLIPNNVISYTLSSNNSTFTIQLKSPCYVHFDRLVYYNTQITGKISYGSVTAVTGIQAKSFFLWLPVTGIKVDSDDSDMLDFFVGPLSQKLPAKQFENVPRCSRKGIQQFFGIEKFGERLWMSE
ncbi:hypothetical protein Lal_00006274 [Lupinus albus]|uniref:Uncharacterized protein n=1 Tax=Lupinus albus TaxID=3870 RepID=A0A6A5MLM3_LUPAL|nr:hypothetical protein Lalb_Chr07g0186681 [Lupinus albus]KAF1875644.1 hypothetical protein Lal_00006274 [Lupinus albus]